MSSRPSPSVLQVYIFREGEFLGTDIFAEREVIVGRDPDEADLVLESGQVSRAHALITIDGNEITIEDQQSTNGILVNDQRVESAKITRLDEITIGEFTLKLKLSGGKRGAKGRAADRTRMQPAGGRAADVPSAPARKAAPEPSSPPILDRHDSSAPFDPNDLSDFDDVEPEDREMRAGPEFRSRLGKVDNNELGEMLEDMGLANEQSSPGNLSDSLEGGAVAESAREEAPVARKSMFDLKGRFSRKKKSAGPVKPKPGLHPQIVEESTLDEEGLFGDIGLNEDAELDAPYVPPTEDELDEDELEELNYVPPYSLADKLVAEDALVAAGSRDAPYQVEIVTLKGDSVSDVALLRPGQSHWVGPKVGGLRRPKDLPPRFKLAQFKRNGTTVIELPTEVEGRLNRAGSELPLDKVTEPPNRSQMKRGRVGLVMKPGEVLDVESGGSRYHVRYARPPEKLVDPRSVKDKLVPDVVTRYSGAGSFGAHIVAFIVVWILGVASASKPVPPGDEFVEVNLEAELELEQEPEPEPEPEPVEEEVAPEPPSAPEPEPKPRKQPKLRAYKPDKSVKKSVAGGTSNKPAGVLGLLSKRGSSAAPGPASAVASLSNLSAAKVPGSKGGFKASGLIGKAPTSDVNLGGGGGGVATKGALALLKGGKGGAGRIAGGAPSGRVRGMVSKAPARRIKQSGGSLSPEEIAKVVNKNVGQIQRCYERELTKNPGLAGKVNIEWVIGTSGSVSSARQKSATLGSTAAINCMLSSIKRWKFPQPRGGSVVVNYPFGFRGI